MKRLIIFLLLFAAIKVAGQTTGYFRFDTVRIMKQNGHAELYLINSTKDTVGILANVGGGLTRFLRSRAINDSTIIVGLDTLTIRGTISSSTAFIKNQTTLQAGSSFHIDGRARVSQAFIPSVTSPSGNNGVKPLDVLGADGGYTSNSGAFAFGGNAGNIDIFSGAGGGTTGTPTVGIGGTGGLISIIAGAGGPGYTGGGAGGYAVLQGGNGGITTTGLNGTPGYAKIAGGSSPPTGNGDGAHVFLIPGEGFGSGSNGNTYLNVGPNLDSAAIRGKVLVGTLTAEPSAAFEVSSFRNGVLFPRMSAVQRNAIASPVAGLLTWDSDSARYMVHNGSSWKGLKYSDEGGGGGLSNSNTGSGFRILNPGTQEMRTIYGSNTILIDSSSNAGGLTFKADTGTLATQYDLTQIVSGINQLTGDITAGPGTGSQATTITNNAITHGKYQQITGPALLGRDTTTSGNIGVITASNDGEVLRRFENEIAFGKVNLSSPNAVTNSLPKNNLNAGANAEKNTFLSGEGINGKWKDIGASTYFTAGDATFPTAGDSLYTNLSMVDYADYEVFREGVKQYWDSVDGVQVIPSTGQFILHPPLVAGERVMITASRRSTLRTPPYPSFNINSIPNVFGWYDATDVTTITLATGVSQWADRTPNANHLAQATGGSQPAYFNNGGSNNQAFLRFASGKTITKSYAVPDSGALTVYMVVKQSTYTNIWFYSFRASGGANGVIPNVGGQSNAYWGYTEYDGSLQNGADLNTGYGDWQVVCFTFKGGGAERVLKNRLAGYSRALHNLGAGNPTNLGRFFCTFGNIAFDISEAIIIKGEVSTGNNTQIVNYLMSKYDIASRPSILFFGDSHTAGAMSGTPTGEMYTILAAKEKGYDIMNQGVSGTVAYPIGGYAGSTGANLGDLYNLYDAYLPANSPYVIFQYGTNDGTSPTNSTWVTNYKAYIQHFIDAGIPLSKIIICTPPYNSSATYNTNLANARPVIQQIATDLGIQFCDFYTYTQSLGLNINTISGGDGIHGNGPVHRAMADLLKTFLQ